MVTTQSGHMVGFDSRRIETPVFNVKAHRKGCSAAAFSPHAANMLVTVGVDKMCKIWDITANASADGTTFTPECISEKDMKQGDLFTVQMYADIPWVLATGGQKGELAIWDTEADLKVKKHFKDSMPEKAKSLKKKADKGFEAGDAEMADGDSSGFEDVDSDEELDTQDDVKEAKTVTKSSSKSGKSKKSSK